MDAGRILATNVLSRVAEMDAADTIVPVSTLDAAEFTKLLENTLRAVTFALGNEMLILCDRMKVDV